METARRFSPGLARSLDPDPDTYRDRDLIPAQARSKVHRTFAVIKKKEQEKNNCNGQQPLPNNNFFSFNVYKKMIEFVPSTHAHLQMLVDFRMKFSDELAGKQEEKKDKQLRLGLQAYYEAELNKNYFSWHALVNGVPAAIAGMTKRVQPPNVRNPSGIWGYVMGVYTLPEYRQQGLSKILVNKLVDTGLENGITAFELHATPAGEQVYPKCGFELFAEPTYRKYC